MFFNTNELSSAQAGLLPIQVYVVEVLCGAVSNMANDLFVTIPDVSGNKHQGHNPDTSCIRHLAELNVASNSFIHAVNTTELDPHVLSLE